MPSLSKPGHTDAHMVLSEEVSKLKVAACIPMLEMYHAILGAGCLRRSWV
eukprot:CAMPEP_0202351926 /NCGR_PEP_ID=MMETSP1126-20121109/8344_1 /ASSEMBLY_ACC=CAM_ASM_000457 /TAXON_ID=3047 /ORGANISM="Dunaliella tertiolecta, Strain CCMP1320" /LENGTH=49 /DNA_ID=CAMNT_0048944077 /DNA_START=744 /DNA_END=893 /DNA_ORIENTATION=+